jgi:50S ribosomal protein L16 3-hydroxylase
MAAFFNTGLTEKEFLQHYWQKKPLLIRRAFSDFESPISPDDLADLAADPDIESRLIVEKKGEEQWRVRHGPFDEQDFAELPKTHWTILVQDVDKHVPELQSLLNPFRFIPDWRRDDLMVSYAPEFGSVGPHTDGYDVFLLQAKGSRRWQVGGQPDINPDIVDGLDVQILADFQSAESWDLTPGDILYLPPHFAHHGVAMNECMTFSIGFRSPSQTDMLDAVINTLLEKGITQQRYQDAGLVPVNHTHEIDDDALVRVKTLLHQTIEQSEPILLEALGKLVTEPKSSLIELAEQVMSDLVTPDQLAAQFESDDVLLKNNYVRFAWSRQGEHGRLFMAGHMYDVEYDGIASLEMLTEKTVLTRDDWRVLATVPSIAELVCELIAEGGWYWQSDLDN